ncbi:MAG: ABC transporter ATP-binding protein [Alphaproteobacteria bacterium]|nr:ABC transporter ATP-binding protein [Alphaproteobacteria bacterium]
MGTSSRTIRQSLFAALLAAPVALPFAAPVNAQEKSSVVLDWFVNPDHGPIIIAKERGFFTAQGLNVDVAAPANPADPPKMAAAGRADIAISYQPQLHLNIHQGMDLVRVGTLVATPLTCLVTLAESPVKKISEFKGKRIGFAVPGVQEVLLDAMLRHNGLTLKDVQVINIGFSISPALMARQVDGVIGAFRNFELNQLQIEGREGRCFYPESEGIPAYDELIYVANPKTMNKDRVRRFLAATELATQFILNHPKESWEIFAGTSASLRNELNRRAWLDTYPRFASRPAAFDYGRYEKFDEFLHKMGAVPARTPVQKLVVDVTAP